MATKDFVESSALIEKLEARGVSRRTFLQYCGAIAGMIGLSEVAAPQVAQALDNVIGNSEGSLLPVIWLEGASCTGCTESIADAGTPDATTIVLELLSINYMETLGAGAGHSIEQARLDTIAAGNYIVVMEGSVVEGWDGNAFRIAGLKGTEVLVETAENALAVISYGSCACDGGWQAARPNPAGAIGVEAYLDKVGAAVDVPKINIPCCPGNPEWIIAVIVQYLMMGQLPELNAKHEPKMMFNQTIHDNCPRRGHFENGEFVYAFGSIEEQKGYCLYPLGCKGPQTFTDCPVVRWNREVSWCVEAGAPCIGCGHIDPMHPNHNWVDEMTPFLKRHRNVGFFSGWSQPSTVAGGIVGILAAALVVHGVGMKAAGRAPHGADFESIRSYDLKHHNEEAEKAAKIADEVTGNGGSK